MSSQWIRMPKEVIDYARVSERTVEVWARQGLRYVKIGGVRLTRPEWVDEFLLSYEATRGNSKKRVDRIAAELLRGFK